MVYAIEMAYGIQYDVTTELGYWRKILLEKTNLTPSSLKTQTSEAARFTQFEFSKN